ncbi:uncharacterized protein LOC142178080 [Nicotiana tabacum]|uniref:Uncharacterized protein LOC142178080 n=1 Tax=Nicotiana tabacum TaxID=4097 RepID=A0AC58U214_TOBAC
MYKLKHEVEQHLVWLVGEGEISFWYDNWTKFGPLYKQLPDNVQPTDIKLKDVLVDGEWQEKNCDVKWNDAIRNIINTEEVEFLDGTPDKAIWSADNKGKFTITAAWDIWRNKKETVDTHSQIWHKDVPFKMSFITWRALTRRLPTDERLLRMGFTVVAHCCCCTTPGSETIEHLFCSGDFAQKVWSNFCGPFRIQWRGTLLIQLLKKWMTYRAKNTIESLVAKIIPQFVVWELWRSRCAICPFLAITDSKVAYHKLVEIVLGEGK